AQEVDEVEDGLQRIVNLVCDGGGHATGGGDLFGLNERVFDTLAGGDIAQDLGSTDYGAAFVLDGRDGERDIHQLAGFGLADGIEVLDALAGADAGEDEEFVGVQFFRDELEDGLADDLVQSILKLIPEELHSDELFRDELEDGLADDLVLGVAEDASGGL